MTQPYIRVGTDVYGRPVYQTPLHHEWEQHRWANLAALGIDPLPYAQGGFMTQVHGGGAGASEGAHDLAKCCDYIIDHLTDAQAAAVVWEFRTHGGAAYRRGPDPKHGAMGKHLHNTLGVDGPGSPMAQILWNSYLGGGDGLAAGPGRPGNAPDYERRPSPLVLTPPEEDMPLTDADVQKVVQALLKTKIKTDDAPGGRYVDSILQKLYNDAYPAKKQ